MGIYIRLPEVEDMLASMVPDDEEVTQIKRQALRELDRKVRSTQMDKPDRLSDRFVNWQFKQDWERRELPLGQIAGTDYDYFEAALLDCIQLFKQFGFPGKEDPDPAGKHAFGEASTSYNRMYEIWENGKPVSSLQGLRGPWVDFGPTVDYALFLEKSITRNTNNLGAPLFRGVGVLHSIADKLAIKYAGVHRVFAHVQKPSGGSSEAYPRSERGTQSDTRRSTGYLPIELFPVIRIMHRHYRGRRRG